MSAEFSHGASGSFVSTRHLGGPCRVCGLHVAVDEPALLRPWCLGRAHVACGWLKPEELAPNEFRYPERFGTFWQWACPCCKRDVVHTTKRDELRCATCIAEGKGSPPPAPSVRKRVTFEIPEGTDVSRCKSCGELLAWVRTPRGKQMPVEVRTHESHFARCPKAAEYRRAKTNTRIATK